MNPKDHILREVVNSLRDIAVEFHGADQLRERLRAALAPLLDEAQPTTFSARDQTLCGHGFTDVIDAARYRHLRAKMCFTSSRELSPTMALSSAIPAPNHDVHNDWVSGRFESSVDAAVDADMQRTEGDEE